MSRSYLLLIAVLFIGFSSESVHANIFNSCLNKDLNLLWRSIDAPIAESKIIQGKSLAEDLTEVILKNAGKNADHIFASLGELSTEELKIFKEEVRSGNWKWVCE